MAETRTESLRSGDLLPVLPLRDIVVFPHMIVPLFVGREKSVRALEAVMRDDKQILLVAQKNAAQDDPAPDDLFQVGTVSTVLQLLKLPDGTVKVLVNNGKRARIVGFTRGIRSFTTAPYVFTSFKNAQTYMRLRENETIFILVRTTPGADLAAVKAGLARAVPGVEVFTRAEMLARTQNYWVFGTGAGTTTLMGAMLGLLVGIVVVAQTIYAATIDHLKEFGTLKAMGATNGQIYQVIILQSVLAAVMGYALGISIALAVVHATTSTDLLIKLPWQVALGIFGLTLFMCMSASLLSIRKATTIDPAMVFRG